MTRKRTDKILVVKIDADSSRRVPDDLVVEEPMSIRLDGHLVATTMRTPGHDYELAAGFCFNEGLLAGAPVNGVRYCADGSAVESKFNVVTVETGGRAPVPTPRLGTTTSSCGVCGTESIDVLVERLSPLPSNQLAAISNELVLSISENVRPGQILFDQTGAVHVAAAFDAERCDIYTDVDGVYTTDPRMMPKARKLERITFEEMLEMASAGAKVLETRSVAMAMRYDVNLQVLSSFSDQPGTLVVNEEQNMEQQKISGIAYSRDEAKITLVGLPDRPGIAAYIFGVLADNHINVDMIVQSASADKTQTDITFSLGSLDVEKAIGVLKAEEQKLEYKDIVGDVDVAKISIIGTAMRTQPGIAKTMFSVLAEKGINLHVISTSEIKISVLVDTNYTELAVRSLHDAFQLDEA